MPSTRGICAHKHRSARCTRGGGGAKVARANSSPAGQPLESCPSGPRASVRPPWTVVPPGHEQFRHEHDQRHEHGIPAHRRGRSAVPRLQPVCDACRRPQSARVIRHHPEVSLQVGPAVLPGHGQPAPLHVPAHRRGRSAVPRLQPRYCRRLPPVHKALVSSATTRRITGIDRRFYPGTANLLLFTTH